MRTAEEIIEEWKAEFGILGRGKNGPYRYIDYSQKKDLLIVLVRTLIDEGYDKDTLKSTFVTNMIVNACEAPEGASSRPASKIRKSKQITANNLKFVLAEFFRGSFSTEASEPQRTELPKSDVSEYKPKNEKILEINPSDRIVMDTSDMIKPELDLDFLEELGVKNE